MTITLINSFVVPQEKEAEFVDMWKSTVDHFINAPGFIEAKLHRNTGLNDRTFLFVNVALWENAEKYRAALKDFTPAGRRVEGIEPHPGLYEVFAEMKAGGELVVLGSNG
jgi:heme-degrading monooxygenase HmoA